MMEQVEDRSGLILLVLSLAKLGTPRHCVAKSWSCHPSHWQQHTAGAHSEGWKSCRGLCRESQASDCYREELASIPIAVATQLRTAGGLGTGVAEVRYL